MLVPSDFLNFGKHGGHRYPGGPGRDEDPAPFPHDPLPDQPRYALDRSAYDAQWVVFALFLLSTLIISVGAARTAKQNRLYHYITVAITATAMISYYAMAAQIGAVEVTYPDWDHPKHTYTRLVFYARYIDWAITTPLLLLDLGLLAGLPLADIGGLIFADLIMIVTGLIGALTESNYKWGLFIIGCLAYVYIIIGLVWGGRSFAYARSDRVGNLFTSLGVFTIILWTVYPVIWVAGEGTGRISVSTEVIAYSVLDVLAKIGFGFWLLVAHRKIEESRIPLSGAWVNGVYAGYGAVSTHAE